MIKYEGFLKHPAKLSIKYPAELKSIINKKMMFRIETTNASSIWRNEFLHCDILVPVNNHNCAIYISQKD